MKIRLSKTLIFALLFSFIFFQGTGHCREELRILTASKDGAYYAAAKSLKNIVERNKKYKLIISTTSGSFYNIQRLGNGEADLALAQGDALHLYITMGNTIANKCLVVTPVEYEHIHIIVHKDSDIKTLKDLKDKKIAVGRKFSGSWVSAYLLLHSEIDLKFEKNENIYTISHTDAIDRFNRDEIDVIFMTTVAGSSQLKRFFQTYGYKAKLLSLGNDFSFSNRRINRFYSMEKIKSRTYPNQREEVYTAATPSFLLAYKYLNSKTIRDLTREIYQNASTLKLNSNLWKLLDIGLAKKQIKRHIPYHRGSKSYFRSRK